MPSTTPAAPVARAAGREHHLPALDGLRGVAIAGVLLFHTGRLPGGFLGVDLFFVLSGYLITGLLLREAAATGRVSLPRFWGRRIRRLAPALGVLLVAVTLLVRATGPDQLVRTTLTDGPWVQLNVVNWHLLAQSASYWDRFGQDRVFEHLWSVAVEEQFYLVWPVVVALVAGRTRHLAGWVAALAASGAVASLATMIALADPADPSRVYTGTDTRAFSLLLGALAATPAAGAVLARLIERGRAGVVTAALAGALGVAWVVVDGTGSPWLYTGGLFAHSLAAALLIGLCAGAPRTAVARALARRPVRALGLISYSLYLWHWPVIVLLNEERTGLTGWTHTLAAGAVAVGLATLSTRLVEDPIRFRAGWARGRRGLAAFAALMIALALLWMALPEPAPPAIDVTELG